MLMLASILVAIPQIVIAIIMLVTLRAAQNGKIVAMNTIKGISVAGMVISGLMIVFSMKDIISVVEYLPQELSSVLSGFLILLPAALLLAGSIFYKKSLKEMKLAKTGAKLALCSVAVTVLAPILISILTFFARAIF